MNTLSELKSSVDDLSKSITPRIVFIEEQLQKLENTVKTNTTYGERVKQVPNLSSTGQPRQQNTRDAKTPLL